MKRINFILLALFITLSGYCQELSEPNTALDSLALELSDLQQKYLDLAGSNNALKKRVTTLESVINNLQGTSEMIANRVSETEVGIVKTENSLRDTKNGLEAQIKDTNNTLSDQNNSVKKRTVWGIIIAISVLLVSALITILLNRRGNAKIDALQSKAEKLNEEIINRLTSDFSEIQKISSSIGNLTAAGVSSQNEQDLIKALADRITFMEMTLFKMDPSVRGYKQLTKSISQMKNNLLANGYEIVDMLGKPYHDGMKVTANFIEDDSIEEGKQIITGIIKPQINYQGKMIQAAQITVSQNL